MPMSPDSKKALAKEQRQVWAEAKAIAVYHRVSLAAVLEAARRDLQQSKK